MEKISLTNVAEWAAIGLSGLFAGSALFVNAVDIPAIFTVQDIGVIRQYWKGPLALTASSAGVAAWHGSTSDYRWVWLVGSGVMISVWPFYIIFMLPGIRKLLDDNVMQEKGERWVKNKIATWNKQHMFRTVAGVLANDIFISAILLTR